MLPKGYGIVLQARTGSTRLPGKMTMPFYNNQCMLEVILEGIAQRFSREEIYLATTTSPADDALVHIAGKSGVHCFRGSENDVLQRFIDCSEHFELDVSVRICADNPFIQGEYMDQLIQDFQHAPSDYSSFAFPDGTPIIRSHIGFFTEIVSTAALKKAAAETSDPFYHEHVTNFIYGNADRYNVRLLPLPLHLQPRTDIRLTIDTADDFEMASALYTELRNAGKENNSTAIVAAIDDRPAYKERMSQLIKRFSK